MDRCLDRLRVEEVPLLVLTHFHADHVDGLPGVVDGRPVAAIETTRLLDPPPAVREVGEVALQVLWPTPDSPTTGPGDGSTANDASVVLLAEVRGVRILLTGDVEPEGQAALARTLPDLRVDVLKVPHHGSRYQDEDWLLSLQPRLVLVSVGADNDYGHPAPSLLAQLRDAGLRVARTDRGGDVAVVVRGSGLRVATRR